MASLLAGGALLLLGAALPAHLRSVDEAVLVAAGVGTGRVIDVAERVLQENRLGVARMLSMAVPPGEVEAAKVFAGKIEAVAKANPALTRWGGPAEWLDKSFGGLVPETPTAGGPVLGWMLRIEIREVALRALAGSSDPTVIALLACRDIEKTAILPPVRSSAGQPMEAALLTAASLLASGRMNPGLALEFERAAVSARQGKGTERLENGLLDLLGASRQLDWEQLSTVCAACPNLSGLRAVATAAGAQGASWPVVLAGISLDGGSDRLSVFLLRHGAGALADVRASFRLGEGAVRELLKRGLRLKPQGRIRFPHPVVGRLAHESPRALLAAKFLAWIDGLFLVILGLTYAVQASQKRSVNASTPKPDVIVVGVMTATAAIVLFLASERYFVSEPGAVRTTGALMSGVGFRLGLRTDLPHVTNLAMNGKILGMLVVFFAIQFCIYLIGLSRLRYIRMQAVEDAIKLRLLDNEEPMFDAPLYIGIAGSVLALVLRLTGFDDVSLMASYSSTLFGILFCFMLKVMHVRPYRQHLILDSAVRLQP